MKKNKPKKLMLTICFALCASTFLFAQTKTDQALVLQKCIDLSELQQYYPLNEAGVADQLYVVNHVISFPNDLEVINSGKQLVFASHEEIEQNEIDSYFIFRRFEIIGDQAAINCNYFYDYNYSNNQFKMIVVTIELNKVGSEWSVTNSNLTGDTK